MVDNDICQALKKAFDIQESTTVMCCLEAMENILKCGNEHFMNQEGVNQFVIKFE